MADSGGAHKRGNAVTAAKSNSVSNEAVDKKYSSSSSTTRKIASVVAGYTAMVAVVILCTLISVVLIIGEMPTEEEIRTFTPSKFYLYLNLTYSLIAAVLGGWITAYIGRDRRCVWFLAGAVFLGGLVNAVSSKTSTPQPEWYLYILPMLGGVGAIIGAECQWPRTKSSIA